MLAIRYIMWSSDGTIRLSINGVEYEYLTDAVYHRRWKARCRFAPGKVLGEIKKAASECRKVVVK